MFAKKLARMISGAEDARVWANELIRRESRGPGDMENAMRRLEARYGIPWRTFWTLRYRKPTDVMVGVYRQLQAAYQSECDRQERLLAHERKLTETKVLAFEAAHRAAVDVDQSKGD